MIRMIASDLDGTLLRKDWSISEYTIKIIKEAQASGIRWVTVTGRSDRGPDQLWRITVLAAIIY